MESVKEYLICVTAAAIICGIGKSLAGENGTSSVIIKLICGLFLCLTVVSPLVDLNIGNFLNFTDSFRFEAEDLAAYGESGSKDAMAGIIKAQVEAYILDKAETLNAHITVEVTLTDSIPPVPCGVHISGSISPYAKTRLSAVLADELGIEKEAQTWST